MNTLHFKYAVEIEKTRSITQAAENLYMAQPNLSKAIKELENTLGITIFKRTSKGVIPTEQGVKFLEYARQILIQIDNMEAIQSPSRLKKQHLKISVPRTGYISMAFSDFTAELDGSISTEISFHETSAVHTIENVRENGYDFGIIRYNTSFEKYFTDCLAEKKLTSQLLWEYEMLAVMSEEHPAAEISELSYPELSQQYTEVLQGDEAVPYLSPSASRLQNEQYAPDDMKSRVFVFDRGSAVDMLTSAPKSFMLDAPMPLQLCRKHRLVQRKCTFSGNRFRDIIVYSAEHRLSDIELSFINKLYEIRNTTVFSEHALS